MPKSHARTFVTPEICTFSKYLPNTAAARAPDIMQSSTGSAADFVAGVQSRKPCNPYSPKRPTDSAEKHTLSLVLVLRDHVSAMFSHPWSSTSLESVGSSDFPHAICAKVPWHKCFKYLTMPSFIESFYLTFHGWRTLWSHMGKYP